jgi:release factor glutamine methyltransferase
MESLKKIRDDFSRNLARLYTPNEIDWLFFLCLEKFYRIEKHIFFQNPFRNIEAHHCKTFIKRLLNHEPWQYITGETEFAGLTIQVNPTVLIPRPETEELIFLIRDELSGKEPRRIIDIGTGSGAIALALKKFFPGSEVYAMDKDPEILETARKNALNNGLEIRLFEGDILSNRFPGEFFDLLVSNPPYVLPDEKKEMQEKVLKFEPHQALFTPGEHPVIYYEKIMDFFLHQKHHGARLYFEINPATAGMLEHAAFERKLKIKFANDLSGKRRFAVIQRE